MAKTERGFGKKAGRNIPAGASIRDSTACALIIEVWDVWRRSWNLSRDTMQQQKKADLNLKVTPGPLLVVKVEGARIWGRTQRKLIPIYQEGTVDQDLLDEGLRNLVSYFSVKKLFRCRCNGGHTAKGRPRAGYLSRGNRKEASPRAHSFYKQQLF